MVTAIHHVFSSSLPRRRRRLVRTDQTAELDGHSQDQGYPGDSGCSNLWKSHSIGDGPCTSRTEMGRQVWAGLPNAAWNKGEWPFLSLSLAQGTSLTLAARHLCQFIRLCQAFLDHPPGRTHLSPNLSHVSLCRFVIPRLHDRHFSMGRLLQGPSKGCRHRIEPTRRPVLHANPGSRVHGQHQGIT